MVWLLLDRLSLLVRLLRRIMRKQKLLQPECCRWHLGLRLAVVVGLRLQFGSGIFTNDKNVVHLISIGIPFVAATQPINSLAFVFDGVNFGASDFIYFAYSMVSILVFPLDKNKNIFYFYIVYINSFLTNNFIVSSGSGICSEHSVFIPSLEKPRFCWNMVWFNHFYGSTCIFWDFESITQSCCSLPITLPSDKLSSSDESLRFYSKICK